MEVVVTVVVLLFVLFVALGVYATVKAVGAAKRGVDRTLTQARRTVEDTTLRAKSYAQAGPAGELAQLRLSLRTSMRATQEALRAGAAEDAGLSESLALFTRLSTHGQELDATLRHLESEPDKAVLAQRMPELRRRTERITASADSLRWAARDRARRFTEDELDSLSAQIDVEAGALRHWTPVPEAPGTPPPAEWPDPAAQGEPPGSGATRSPSRQSPPEDAPRERPALTEPAPPQAPYPWERKSRPENTT
ncbi:hypothetical protein DUI70_5205 [Streptomyces albus]|nr:hypothetical protein DUI70_5205 [Streptomyces albus]